MRPILIAAVLAAPAATQVPDGAYVVSSLWTQPTNHSPGGLFIVDPRIPGLPVAVRGLGADLAGRAAPSAVGASAVAIRPDDGVLLVGEFVSSGEQVDLHEIVLSGTAVASDRRIPIGVGLGVNAGIAEIALMPNGDALIAVQGMQAGPPLNGARLAIVTRAGQVNPVPTPILQDEFTLALAVDPTGSTAYIVVAPIEPHAVHLQAVPLPAGGSAPLILTFRWTLTGLTFRASGALMACSTTDLYEVDPIRRTLTTIAALPPTVTSIASETATDGFAIVQNGRLGAPSGVHVLDGAGTATRLTSGVTGVLSDITVLDNPRTYGTGTPGTVSYDWQVAPAPGGLPQAGNSGFVLQVSAPGAPTRVGAVIASLAPGSFRIAGVDVLLDPLVLIALGSTSSNGTFRLPIPLAAPIGATIFVQSFHLDPGAPGSVAATPGQRFQVMR